MERELATNEKAIDSMGQEEVDATKETENQGNELKDTADEAEKSGGKFKKFGGVLKGIGAAMGAVALAAGAVAIELGKQVVSAYAETMSSWSVGLIPFLEIPQRQFKSLRIMPSKRQGCPPMNTWKRSLVSLQV